MDEDILLAAAHQEYKAGNCKLALQHCLLVHDKSPRRTDALLLLGAIYYQVDLTATLMLRGAMHKLSILHAEGL